MSGGWLINLAECLSQKWLWVRGGVEWSECHVWSTIIAILAVLTFFITREHKYDMDKIPGPWRNGWPLLGNLGELLTYDHHLKLLEYANTYGGIVRLKVLWVDALLVTDPLVVAKIMGSLGREGSIDKSATTYGPINEMVHPNSCQNLLTSLSTDQWRTVRKALAISFGQVNMKKQYSVVLGKVNELIARLELMDLSRSMNIDQAALKVTLDVIGLTAFGHDFNSVSLDHPPPDHLMRILRRCFTEVELRLANPLRSCSLIPRFLFEFGEKGATSFENYHKTIQDLFHEIVGRGMPADDDFSVAAQLMRLKSRGSISDERVLAEIGILFVGGFQTTAHTISWTLFCIATNRGVQDRVIEELDAAGLLRKPGTVPQELKYSDLRKLSYLNACMKESMRMYPVVSVGNGRMTDKVVKIGPYQVPRGVLVGVPLYALHNARHNWESPSQFRPERWLEIPSESFVYSSTDPHADGQDSITYMPFSEGHRNCAGQSLAKMETLTFIAKLLSTFQLMLAPEEIYTADVDEDTILNEISKKKSTVCHVDGWGYRSDESTDHKAYPANIRFTGYSNDLNSKRHIGGLLIIFFFVMYPIKCANAQI